MDDVELNEAIRSIVDSLSRVAPDENWKSVTHLAEHGEEGEAMDVLVAIVVRFNVPVTTVLQRKIGKIVAEFATVPELRSEYRYAADLEMLDRMTVVDEPLP